MSAASRVHNGASQTNSSAAAVSILKFGLPAVGTLLLATRIYFVAELLFLLAVLVILFSVGTGGVILFVIAQDCARWSVHKFKEAKQAILLSLHDPTVVGMPKFILPGTTLENPKVGSSARVYVAQVDERG